MIKKTKRLTDEDFIDKSRIRHAEWRGRNREHVKSKYREWKLKNKDKVKESYIIYSKTEKAKELRRAAQKERTKNNPIPARVRASIRCKRVKYSIPKWETTENIKMFYVKAKKLGFEVDHIVPIKSDIVCGLHCVDNFQMLGRSENASKSNRYWTDMP
jgi:hypothetical protein